jgi:transposase
MFNNYNKYKFNSNDFEVFCGLDVSKKSIAVTFVKPDGQIKSLKLPYDSGALASYTGKHFAGKRVAFVYEAGPTGYGLHDDLNRAGYYCMICAPAMVLKAPGDRVKTDRRDSRNLAEQLKANQLKAIHVPIGSYRYLRHLAKLRKKCAGRKTAAKLQIKSLLLHEQIAFPVNDRGRSSWSNATVERLRVLECAGPIRFKLDRYLEHLRFWDKEVLQVQRQLRKFCKEDPELRKCVHLLMSISGIGVVVAIYLLSRIGDWRDLKNSRQLGAFFGLTPSEDSTGGRVNRGPITRMGDRLARALLIEASWAAIKKDRQLAECYRRIFYSNNGSKDASRKAIVAVARRLTARIYAVLTQQRPYRVA